MPASTRVRFAAFAKVALAVILVGAIAAFAVKSMFPATPLATVVLYTGGAMGALFVGLVIAAYLSSTINQAVLRAGGTDAQWLWFKADPPGLIELRKQGDVLLPDAPPRDAP